MRKRWNMLLLVGVLALSLMVVGANQGISDVSASNGKGKSDVIFAIHGGAGGGTVPEELEDEYRETMKSALKEGKKVIDSGGSSVQAVEAAVKVLEDSPLFNAGKGAVFNTDAEHELDASIMNGENLQAGAVAGSRHAKNPITLARMIMDESPHVMLAGDAADQFGMQHGVKMVTQDYYFTEKRWKSLMEAKKKKAGATGHGTVGAVALDPKGNLAAATSTGGLTNKAVGRVGDSPIIGAGTYANNDGVAVSATGKGEVFIRGTAAVDISALVQYQKMSVKEAASKVVKEKLPPLGGTGGVIALDGKGNFAAPYSTPTLFYGYVTKKGEFKVVLSPEDEK
ncbi:beta-aspartyl-peptidase (threonine type) [Melghirimyces profundicolus]|uniref:Beta-aspartyl-peptidase (Threonine type) n=1 Tax=Melghirimyces profundicolus TaxID=1242148 RepID=A0A2T6C0A1_9BACL|nr:isoaspartyl peptidase/L-asparaginase [Melghirimyces profundicolus]PTX61749.1 beta-aspartyl-peptidase (threonine type) [Melghirimyces profundicolus]